MCILHSLPRIDGRPPVFRGSLYRKISLFFANLIIPSGLFANFAHESAEAYYSAPNETKPKNYFNILIL